MSLISEWVLAFAAALMKERRAWCFRVQSFVVPGLAKFIGKCSRLRLFAKRLAQGAPTLAYKIERFCLVPS
jgi:hypothetical protein